MPGSNLQTMTTIRRYSELIALPTFKDRFDYLKLGGRIGDATFGYERFLNQTFYHSPEWKAFRQKVIIRDGGFDLAIEDTLIFGRIEIHHLNPITIGDIETRAPCLMDFENVISTSARTHKAIHYCDTVPIIPDISPRKPNDTCPWLT